MFDKDFLKEVLDECLKNGADYAEIYCQDTSNYVLQAIGNDVSKIIKSQEYGAGIRVFNGLIELFASTNDVSKENLLKVAKSLSQSVGKESLNIKYDLKEVDIKRHVNAKKTRKNFGLDKQTELVLKGTKAILDYDKTISQAVCVLTEADTLITFANTKGKFYNDNELIIRFSAQAVATDGVVTQTANNNYGYNSGYEIFDDFDVTAFCTDIASKAVTMLHADEMVGGDIPVIIHNGFGGVIFHEACGHPLEASSVSKNLSIFSGKLGEKIASDLVTAIDDGTLENEWGSSNIDDEGNPTQRNVLIENGVLKGYLIDEIGGKRMGLEPNGAGRRESYKYMPTSRMSNTYIANGTSTFEEIIANTKYGLFAKSLGGGSVDPSTGEFNFSVLEGYMVIDGRIDKPVRGASIVGNGSDILKRIDMVGNNQTFGHGMCGAASGSIPANVGQPTIRLSHMTVGGKGSK